MTPTFIPYSDDVETIERDEQQTIDHIIEAMRKGDQLTREKYGRSVRTSHAKAHGLLRAEVQVLPNLAEPLRQGVFVEPRMYPVIIRLSHVPGELLDDRHVSMPRGMALKVLGVEGPKLPSHAGKVTQDFILDTGKVFNTPGIKTFLAQIVPIETVASRLPDAVKAAVSTVSRATNAALHVVGMESTNLDFLGHPFVHPLAEPLYSQAPMRYGDYVAKLRISPVTPALKALAAESFEPKDEHGLRTAVIEYFQTQAAEFEMAFQLCTDLEHMPVENAHTEWPEDESPYQPVARLLIPAQNAFAAARQAYVEDDLSFCPAHSLAAHRPLGSIRRARMQAYEAMSRVRRGQNGRPIRGTAHIEELPD
jgi:hypothetical protein